MDEITMIGIDLAKSVFQLHGVDERGVCRLRKTVRRRQLLAQLAQLPASLVAMEACASAHHWGRQISALGHTVRLIPPQYVKPFVHGNKTDRNDAEAICEAAQRPRMHFVAVKSVEQQQILTLHRIRALLVKQRTALANHLRGLLGEFGYAWPKGLATLRQRLPALLDEPHSELPPLLRQALRAQYEHLCDLDRQVRASTTTLEHLSRELPRCQPLLQHRGVGALTATAVAAELPDPSLFRNGRQFAASLGLVPRQLSTGGQPLLLGISKRGNVYLRTLLTHGARAVVRTAAGKSDPFSQWINALLARRGHNKTVIAVANKTARHLWATLRYAPAS